MNKKDSRIKLTVLILCALVTVSWIVTLILRNEPQNVRKVTPDLVPFLATILSACAILLPNNISLWARFKRPMLWVGLLLMIWSANGLPFDILNLTSLMPHQAINWPGIISRIFALLAVIFLARLALAQPETHVSGTYTSWYGYAAFLLALPYPVLRIWWAFGGTPGLLWPGAAGVGLSPLLFAIPWMLAAVLSLFLVSTKPWKPRRFLVVSGYTATAIVSMIGPAACWILITGTIKGNIECPEGMATWIPWLFYGSWFLWAIAGAAATRSYQLRSTL